MERPPVVLITDVGPIGYAIASAMVARGFRIAAFHSRFELGHAEALVHDLGHDSVYTHALASPGWDDITDAIGETTAVFGEPPRRAAIFVSQRWLFDDGGPLFVGGVDDNAFGRVIVHLQRIYTALRALLPAMVANNDGAIVVGGSRLGERPWENEGAALPGAICAAALALVQACAAETKRFHVRVNAISLGVVPDLDSATVLPNLGSSRWSSPEAIAKLVVFLLSDEAREVTGATIPMYGGV